MNRTLEVVIFLMAFGIIFLIMNYSIYFFTNRLLFHASKSPFWLKLIFIISFLTVFVGNYTRHIPELVWLKIYAYFWLGSITIISTVFLLTFALRLIIPSKSNAISIISLIIGIIVITYSYINAARPPIVKTMYLKLFSKTPNSNFTIVQLSDLHIGNFSEKWLKGIVKKTNSLSPDIIVLTGDILNERLKHEDKFSRILTQLKSKHGVFAVTGNHEFIVGIDTSEEFIRNSNIKLLRYEQVLIADKIILIGIDDDFAGKHIAKNLSKLTTNLDCQLDSLIKKNGKEKVKILLYHRPNQFEKSSSIGIDLQLSGHTHAGQIPPIDLFVYLRFKYPHGLYKYKESYLYTSCGTGTWGPQMRLFTRSEIVRLIIN